MQKTTPETTWLRITEAAELKRCSTKTIRRMIAAGELRAEHFGKRVILVERQSLIAAGKPVTWY
jgi:excisionase family DNA binding protein